MPNRQERNEGPKSNGFLTNQDSARPFCRTKSHIWSFVPHSPSSLATMAPNKKAKKAVQGPVMSAKGYVYLEEKPGFCLARKNKTRMVGDVANPGATVPFCWRGGRCGVAGCDHCKCCKTCQCACHTSRSEMHAKFTWDGGTVRFHPTLPFRTRHNPHPPLPFRSLLLLVVWNF